MRNVSSTADVDVDVDVEAVEAAESVEAVAGGELDKEEEDGDDDGIHSSLTNCSIVNFIDATTSAETNWGRWMYPSVSNVRHLSVGETVLPSPSPSPLLPPPSVPDDDDDGVLHCPRAQELYDAAELIGMSSSSSRAESETIDDDLSLEFEV